MNVIEVKNCAFKKLGECLYRYKATDRYYARIETPGKEIRRCLETTDRAVAKCKLANFGSEPRRWSLCARDSGCLASTPAKRPFFSPKPEAGSGISPLPDDIVSVGIVAPPEYLFAHQYTKDELLAAEIAKCPALAERLKNAERVGPARGLGRLAYLNRKTCGDGWVMIGDARAFLDPIYSSGLFLALGSAELAAQCIHDALVAGDVSAIRLGKFEPALWAGVDVIRRLIHAFYDPSFSFTKFVQRFPEHRAALIDCLVGDVLKDMRPFTEALSQMTPPPAPLLAAA